MRIRSIFIGSALLALAFGTNHLFLLLAMVVGVIGIYLYVRSYHAKQNQPKRWKTTPRDTAPILPNIGTENVGFTRERYSDDERR